MFAMSGSSGTVSTQNFVLEEIRQQRVSRDQALLQLVNSQICLRRVTLSFNLFFWITGPGLVGLGIWNYLALSQYEAVIERQHFAGPAYLILVAGGAAILAGIVGCLGAVNEHRHLLLLYSILVVIVCSLELCVTIYTFTQYDTARSTVEVSFGEALASYRSREDGASQEIVDSVQRRFSCCGIEGPEDWVPASNGSAIALSVLSETESSAVTFDLPSSCCSRGSSGQGHCSSKSIATLSRKGCLSPLLDWLRWILLVSGWSSFAAACSQVLGLAIVCCFTRSVAFIYV